MIFVKLLMLMVAAHALCDYPLQGDFLAKGKNRYAPLPGVPWYQCMAAHAAMHAGAVLLITGMPWLAIAEFAVHFWIDDAKCYATFYWPEDARGLFNTDQACHIACKVTWALVAFRILH